MPPPRFCTPAAPPLHTRPAFRNRASEPASGSTHHYWSARQREQRGVPCTIPAVTFPSLWRSSPHLRAGRCSKRLTGRSPRTGEPAAPFPGPRGWFAWSAGVQSRGKRTELLSLSVNPASPRPVPLRHVGVENRQCGAGDRGRHLEIMRQLSHKGAATAGPCSAVCRACGGIVRTVLHRALRRPLSSFASAMGDC